MPRGVGRCPCPGASAQEPGSAEPPLVDLLTLAVPFHRGWGGGLCQEAALNPAGPCNVLVVLSSVGQSLFPSSGPSLAQVTARPLVPQAPCPEPGSLSLGEGEGSRQVAPGIWFLDPREEAPTVAADPPCCWDHSPCGPLGPAGQAAGGEGGAVPAAFLPGTPFSSVNGASLTAVDAGGAGAGSQRPAPCTEETRAPGQGSSASASLPSRARPRSVLGAPPGSLGHPAAPLRSSTCSMRPRPCDDRSLQTLPGVSRPKPRHTPNLHAPKLGSVSLQTSHRPWRNVRKQKYAEREGAVLLHVSERAFAEFQALPLRPQVLVSPRAPRVTELRVGWTSALQVTPPRGFSSW